MSLPFSSRLVRAFTRTDAEIEREIREDVLERTMWIDTGNVDISVQSGPAALSGRLHTRSDVELLTRLAGRVPGVVAVESTVVWNVDDTTRKGRRALEHPVR
jgi:osmotically-inducible protein OsmY